MGDIFCVPIIIFLGAETNERLSDLINAMEELTGIDPKVEEILEKFDLL